MDFFFNYASNELKWSLDFPSKVLSSSYFSIHHTGEINPKEIPLLSPFSHVCVPASDNVYMPFPPQVFVVLL